MCERLDSIRGCMRAGGRSAEDGSGAPASAVVIAVD